MTRCMPTFDHRTEPGPTGPVHTCAVEVPADLVHFEGHFAGEPVLAGAAQLDGIVLACVEGAFADLGPLARAVRLKLHRPVGPGDRLELRLERRGDRVGFTLSCGEHPVSSGQLFFHS